MHCFKRNCTPVREFGYVKKRLGLACELLARTNWAIVDIALSTGFPDQSALTRTMRQDLATTPAAYRQRK